MPPLDGLLVVDFAQYLAGPSAALRLADLGARVVKVERRGGGDGSRQVVLAGQELDGASLLFHTLNRGKETLPVDLAEPADRARLEELLGRADVLIHSFRPGGLDKYGLDYASVTERHPRLVYGQVTGYGPGGPWATEPGQDLLVQARSGMTWLSGAADGPPTPFGLSVVDQVAGANLVQGVLACLVRRGVSGRGGLVEVSLLEAAMDLQLEAFTCYLNGAPPPTRSSAAPAHPYLGAPYGIYRTADGWLALAIGSIPTLGQLLDLDLTAPPGEWAEVRDEIKRRVAARLVTGSTEHWLGRLGPAGYWCAEVRDWAGLERSGALDELGMVIEVPVADGATFRTTRCPIRIDGGLPRWSG